MAKQDFKLELKNIPEITRMLEKIPYELNQKIQLDINRAAAKIALEELQNSTPQGDSSKSSKNVASTNVVIANDKKSKTGVLIGFKKRAWYIMLQELGTRVRELTGKGKYRKGTNRGSIERKPFILDAYQRATPLIINYLNENYSKLINKAIKKQANIINRKNSKK